MVLIGDSTSSSSFQEQERAHEPSDPEGQSFKSMGKDIIISRIRATDVITRLRRIPVGFYLSVNSGTVTRRTSSTSHLVGDDVLEWDDELVLSLDPSSRMFFTVLASFELGSTLDQGEVLVQFEIAAGELLDPNEERQRPIKLVEQGREDTSSPLSLEIEWRSFDRKEHPPESDLPKSEVTHHLAELMDTGHRALIRYRELEERQSLEDAIKHFAQARDVCPLYHLGRASVLFHLANAQLLCCRHSDITPNYDTPIDCYRAVLDLRPRGHPDRPLTLLSLAVVLLARSQTKNSEADEAEGAALLSRVLEDSQPGSYVYHAAVLAQGSAAKFELIHLQEIPQNFKNDLSDNMALFRLDSALQRMFCWDRSRHSWLDPLGVLICIRPERLRDHADPEKAVWMLEIIVKFTSNNHPDKPLWLDSLGYLVLARYRRSGGVADLERSVSTREEAVRLAPDGHPLKPSWLNNLAMALSTRYRKFGDVVDLDKSISMVELMVRLTPSGHRNKALGLNNLGSWLLTRYERFGDFLDLGKSIMVFEEAVQRTPDNSPDKLPRLNNLGYSLWTHYERFSDVADLEKSIATFTDVVRLTPDSHPDKPSRLHNLGISLSTRFERFGDVSDLEKAIAISEDVVRQTPDEHPNKPPRLNDLGNLFSMRYDRLGDISDLEKSISNHEAALQLGSDDDPEKASWLNNLGYSLSTCYQRFGDVTDLEKSILMTEDAVRLTPDDHQHKPRRLSSLGGLFSMRYDHFGDLIDMEKSISLFEHAVRLTPTGRPTKALGLNNLGHALSTRYQRSGNAADLEQSISKHEDAVRLTPNNHPDKPSWINNLGTSLLTRYDRERDVADLEKAISMLEDAVRLMPDGHPDKPSLLNNFGRSLLSRYQLSAVGVDLEKSILVREDVVRLTPNGHPEEPFYLYSLALSLLERFKCTRDSSSTDISQAILYSSRAARSSIGPSRHRFTAAQVWIQCVRLQRHDSQTLLDAYAVAVDLLPQLAWIGLPLHDRHYQLVRAANTACDAAAVALKANKPGLAVEWLEQGRSIVWSQLSQLRTPVDGLRAINSKLSTDFERVSRQLEHATARWDPGAVKEFTSRRVEDGVLQKQAQKHHVLAFERERLLAEIRALPGFKRFLLPKTIDELSPLVHSGSVVFLNGSKHGCDALIVVAGSDSERVIHIPLPNINYDELSLMRFRLAKLLRLNNRTIPSDDSGSDRLGGARIEGITPENVFGSILPFLWDKGINLVLEKVLALSTLGSKLPRIFWCPTGSFSSLPVHAAGHYCAMDLAGPKLSDYVISSYIPTMNALALPPPDETEANSRRVLMLAVPQPSTDGRARLRWVGREIEVIRRLTSSSPSVDFQESDGTVEDVLAKMQASDWVHFACHGTQDRKNPLDSGLLLAHERRLKVSDIVQLSRPRHGGLAFLSACQTAAGDEQLSDEAIHIAAGMLLAGYRGVVATMWSIMDSDAPKVAEEVYKRLFTNGEVRPDGGDAAEALHYAVERLRDDSRAPFLSWVPFIHVGL